MLFTTVNGVYVLILAKYELGFISGHFSQTHPVTLNAIVNTSTGFPQRTE
jgi:hypothetical protein